jgi:hypothetical protein
MNRLNARVRKIEAMTRKRFPIEERRSAHQVALQSTSVEDLYLLQEDLTLKIEGREAELTDLHHAATARMDRAISNLEAEWAGRKVQRP